eukprot:1195021-Prorocentrum_minimum.AAC.3
MSISRPSAPKGERAGALGLEDEHSRAGEGGSDQVALHRRSDVHLLIRRTAAHALTSAKRAPTRGPSWSHRI